MPIYEYRCKHCRNDFEALVWSSAEEITLCCPKCRNHDVERILSVFSKSCNSGGLPKTSCAPKTGGFS